VSALTLRLRAPPPLTVDLSAISPERLKGLTRAQIEAIELELGNRTVALAELFAVSGDDPHTIVIENAHARLTHLGAGMRGGTLRSEGDAGDYTGLRMSAGRILVAGNVGNFAGCEMSGGAIEIRGGAGDFVGGALAGDKQGMRGGLIHVRGRAGDRVADHMRRGLILLEQGAGAYLGSRMLAGTVLVRGAVGAQPGYGLKRGTLLLHEAPPELPATFNDCGAHDLLFLTLLERELAKQSGLAAFVPLPPRVRRYCGDLATGGKGEILLPA
jgi:formylmethanofuran dehydrogenase subunit C